MSYRTSGGRVYSPTCLQIDASLKARAKEAGINISRTLRDALEAKLGEIESGPGQTATNSRPGPANATHPNVEAIDDS